MGPIGSSKYTVYKSPTESLRQSTGLYATSPMDVPDNLIGADFTIFNTQNESVVEKAGKAIPKLNSAQDILKAKRTASAAAGGSLVTPNLLDTASAKSANPGKSSLFAKSTLTPGQQMGIGVAGMAVDTIGEIADAKKNLAVDEYLLDLNYWKDQGKIWFDKDAVYAPTFAEYAPNMPSAVDALKEGSISGSSTVDSTVGGAAKGALAGAVVGSVVPVVGTAVGAIAGTVIGGLTGLITGIMSSDAAEGQDVKMKQRAYDEYKAKLKVWTYSRNLKNQNDRISEEDRQTAKSMAIAASSKKNKQDKLDKIAESKNTNRNRMLKVLESMGKSGEDAAQQRKARWA